jgi:hypothetical protein
MNATHPSRFWACETALGHDVTTWLQTQLRQQILYRTHLSVFVSQRGDRVKISHWDNGGFVVLYKRFEQDRFRIPNVTAFDAASLRVGGSVTAAPRRYSSRD